MTLEQRLLDFEQLSATFAKNYGPYEWKRDRMGFDLYRTGLWVTRIRAAKDDLEYMEILSEYVASLRDAHSQLLFSSDFNASVGLQADIYDGRVLLDFVDRTELPRARFPTDIGDEVISLDGKPVMAAVDDLARFIGMSEPRARRRWAARYLFFRTQQLFPRAHEVGERLVVAIRHADGSSGTYEIPWIRRGVPIERPAPVPSPKARAPREAETGPSLLERLNNRYVAGLAHIRGFGARNPYFQTPQGFQLRLGRNRTDLHYSGIYLAEGKRIGYLRIPTFAPSSSTLAVREVFAEITFLNENTDGLVVDVSRNPGGNCFGVAVLQMLIPWEFQVPGNQLRATLNLLVDADSALASARLFGASEEQIRQLEEIAAKIRAALDQDRGLTEPIPVCSSSFAVPPLQGRNGEYLAYTRPLIVLADELSISMGDLFAAAMQDNGRGKLFGFRTNGAGGQTTSFVGGFFSETITTLSLAQGVRPRVIGFEDVGATNLIENAGVRPDIPYDYMTEDNLRRNGAPFVESFTRAILDEIAAAQGQPTAAKVTR